MKEKRTPCSDIDLSFIPLGGVGEKSFFEANGLLEKL